MVASNREKFSQTFFDRLSRLTALLSNPVVEEHLKSLPHSALQGRRTNQKAPIPPPPFCKDIRNTSRSTSRLRQPVVLLVPWTGKLKTPSYQVCYPLNFLSLDILYIVVTSVHYARLKCVKWRKVKWKWWFLTRLCRSSCLPSRKSPKVGPNWPATCCKWSSWYSFMKHKRTRTTGFF